MDNRLEEARKIINKVDAQMAELFVERMRAAELVYAYKKEYGLPILDAKREAAVIERNASAIEDEVLRGYYIDFLRDVMAVSRAYQYRMQSGLKVAYSGVEGAFAHIAAGRIFPEANRIPYRDFASAYDAVVRGESDFTVLPIENSYAGEVGQTIDLLFTGTLYVNGIYELKICQNLLGVPGSTVADIRRVTSHPQALSQCHDYIALHGFTTEEASNTAIAAKTVAASGTKRSAPSPVWRPRSCTACRYSIRTSTKARRTPHASRYCPRCAPIPRHNTNSVLMFSVKNEAGTLANAIGIIGKYGYNMTALRSRPLKDHSWQYYFYVELDGSTDTDDGKRMMQELGAVCDKLKLAGTFAPHTEI